MTSVVAQANSFLPGRLSLCWSASSTPPFVAASINLYFAQGSAATPLIPTTPLTAGSVTTVSDASTGQTFTFKAAAGDTIGQLCHCHLPMRRRRHALRRHHREPSTSTGKLAIGSNSARMASWSAPNDPVLGAMNGHSGY